MYRQIIVLDDRDYQRILWRRSPEESVQEFQLNIVTYGVASSSYLAIKCIRRLAEQAEHDYPIAARVVLDEMYVDDIMTGADNVQGVIKVQQQLTELLQAGGFEIHKWCSNRPESLDHVPQERREAIPSLSIDANDTIKTLGLEWRPTDDKFQFAVQQTEAVTTKRQILSAISKFFDPLGLIGPILTTAKLLMQETWRLNYHWDESLPATFVEKWEQFRQDLNEVETLVIPRRVISCEGAKRIFIQGFCDASERAYGACIYIQAEDESGALTSRLLCSKSRVAPIKEQTIPRLELCSTILLARLIASVQRGLQIRIDGLQAWSDSMVALCWIRGDVCRWKPFVTNRVSEIIQILPTEHWDHVRGKENPADLISHGTSPRQLTDSELWWSGPQWLKGNCIVTHSDLEGETSSEVIERVKVEERKPATICNFVNEGQQIVSEIIDKFSSLTKIERVLAYCLRYISNLSKEPVDRVLGHLSIAELQEAHRRIVKYIQANQFAEEISALTNGRNLKTSSKLI